MQGMRNDELPDAIGRCDLVVDQLYSDTPMAGPAFQPLPWQADIGCRFLFTRVAQALAGLPIPPTRFVHPLDFDPRCKPVGDDAARVELGKAAKQFVDSIGSASRSRDE